MNTNVQLFRCDRKLTACALGEPSLTLVRNDARFGLPIAEGAHEEPARGRVCLDEISYLSVSGKDCAYREFETVEIFQDEGVWYAQEPESGQYFPNRSHRPYHVVFITREEYLQMLNARAEGLAWPVFQAAQRHFGGLPGFSFKQNSLETPKNYADCREVLPLSQLVPAGAAV